jgi:hypothetical protein
VRTISFIALCYIDLAMYMEAFQQLKEALEVNKSVLLATKEQIPNEGALPAQREEILYCQRTNWILMYHTALCLYMMRSTEEAEKVSCLD